jgi:hypothetical protein
MIHRFATENDKELPPLLLAQSKLLGPVCKSRPNSGEISKLFLILSTGFGTTYIH